MRKLFVILLSLLSTASFAQTDSSSVDTTKSNFDFYTGCTLASRNYARGVNFGEGPSIQPVAGIAYKNLTLEFFAAISANGVYNYGTTHDFSLSYSAKGFKVGLHDYYFFNKNGNHNYFFETGSDTMNGHYYEVQASYKNDKFSILSGYNFYNTNLKVDGDYWKGGYLEGTYNISDNFSIIVAGLTGPSIVNFYEAAGITTIGLNWSRKIEISKKLSAIIDAKFHVNPNYKNISPGVQKTPMNFFVSLTF